MKVVMNENKGPIFRELQRGDVFSYEGIAYMKTCEITTNNSVSYNCVALNGTQFGFMYANNRVSEHVGAFVEGYKDVK